MNAFIDVEVVDQVMELVEHTGSLVPEGEALVKSLEAQLKAPDASMEAVLPGVLTELVKASTIFYAGNGEDVESVMNSIARLVCLLKQEDREGLIKMMCQSLTSEAHPGNEASRMRVVGNIFNKLDAVSPSRYDTYIALVTLVGRCGALSAIEQSFDKLDTWVKFWQISTAQTRALYQLLHEVSVSMAGYVSVSCRFLTRLLETYDTDAVIAAEAATIKPLAMKLVAQSLSDPEQFSVADVLQLKAVQAFSGEKWFELLSLFEAGDIPKYRAWVASNGAVLEAMALSPEDMLQKIRLQGFCYLCTKSTTIPFGTISKALEVEDEDVELWTIEAIKAGLIEARIDQANGRVLVSRSRTNKFVESDWAELRERLVAWKKNLGQCQLVMNEVKMQIEAANKRGNALKKGR
mmetsp:Transcript_17258/g.44972  ORF Transcript_17258/g.44972 Transcript_17258/m.44972 type:complete len:407 (-) Transcript_17258:821-2041(-)